MLPEFQTARLKISEQSPDMDQTRQSTLLARIPELLSPAVVANLPPWFHNTESTHKAQLWLDKILSESRLFTVQHHDTGSIIGFIFVSVNNQNDAHIGYLLDENFWGQGLASELLTGFIRQASIAEPWHRLIAGVDHSNTASSGLLQKLGFIRQPGHDTPVIFYEYQLPGRH